MAVEDTPSPSICVKNNEIAATFTIYNFALYVKEGSLPVPFVLFQKLIKTHLHPDYVLLEDTFVLQCLHLLLIEVLKNIEFGRRPL